MDNGTKAAVAEPGRAPATAIERDQELTAQALDGIHGAERLSGFGRFVTKIESIFQGSQASELSKSRAHLRAVPIMMSAGVLLLMATGLLFLFSKPESAVPGHFHLRTGLSGQEHQGHGGADASAPVTENQLVDASTSGKAVGNRPKFENRGHSRQTRPAVAGDEIGLGNQNSTRNELRAPATVFTVSTASYPLAVNQPTMSSKAVRQSPLELPAGTEIVAHTTNAISSGLESPVVAVVDRNVELNDSVVIPQGTRVIGSTAGAVKDRINVRFTSVLLPSNREFTISGLALMKDGSAGLAGKIQGSGHPILSAAARVGTGAAVVATEFAGQGSLNQPFSQADYLRNQMAAEAGTEGNRLSNRFQQPMSVPIVKLGTNQPLRIFLLKALDLGNPHEEQSQPVPSATVANATTDQGTGSEQGLVAAQTAYIQALEAQLAEMRASLDGKQPNGQH